jgi:hypothetical protein
MPAAPRTKGTWTHKKVNRRRKPEIRARAVLYLAVKTRFDMEAAVERKVRSEASAPDCSSVCDCKDRAICRTLVQELLQNRVSNAVVLADVEQ